MSQTKSHGKLESLRKTAGRYRLLSLGIDKYAHHPDLKNAGRDADAAEKYCLKIMVLKRPAGSEFRF